MKIKTRIQLSAEYQVSEVEAEIEVTNDASITDAVDGMQNECIINAVEGLRNALGQLKALKKNNDTHQKTLDPDEIEGDSGCDKQEEDIL